MIIGEFSQDYLFKTKLYVYYTTYANKILRFLIVEVRIPMKNQFENSRLSK